MLEIKDLYVGYGKIVAVQGLTISVPSGSIVALLGPNGAGKTTSVRAIFGLLASS
ncbi:MAG: ATP-binding cassette domain-containing protein, partial [Acidobacteria bacterium]|nr:ATP-binding cassette domain-containing protein [Acidobacteriota bacterium]